MTPRKAKDDYKTAYLNLHKKARLGHQRRREEEGSCSKTYGWTSSRSWLRGSHFAPRFFDRASDPSVEAHSLFHARQRRPGRLADLPTLQLPPAGGDSGGQRSGGPDADRRPARHHAGEPGARPWWTISPDPTAKKSISPIAARRPESGRRGLREVEDSSLTRSRPIPVQGIRGRSVGPDGHPGAALRTCSGKWRAAVPLARWRTFGSGSRRCLDRITKGKEISRVRLVIDDR